MDLLFFLNAKNYQTYNRKLAQVIGLEASIFLSELCDKFEHFHSEKKMIDEEWFYLSQETVTERTALSRTHQESAIRELKKLSIIEVKLKACPATRHFKMNIPKLLEFLSLHFPANWIAGSCKLDRKILQTAPIEEEPKEEKEKDKKENTPPSGSPACGPVCYGKFVKLTKEEFERAREFCGGTAKLSSIIEEINDYLASTGNKPYKDYEATIRNWCRRKSEKPPSKAPGSTNEGQSMSFARLAKEKLTQAEFRGSVEIQEKYIQIIPYRSNHAWELKYNENGFRSQLASQLRKMGYPKIATEIENANT